MSLFSREFESNQNTNLDSIVSSMSLNVDNFPRLASETDDSQRIKRAINSLTNGGEIILPARNYIINSTFSFNNKSNITLRGTNGTRFTIASGLNFMNIINSSNIKVEGIEIIESGYTDGVFFQEVSLNYASILTPNTNPNLTATIASPSVTLQANANATNQIEEKYVVTIPNDSTKEYVIITNHNVMMGENSRFIKVRQYTDATTYYEYALDEYVKDASNPSANAKWMTNFIPSGIVKVELVFSHTKANNSDNNPIVFDLSKIKLFMATRPLPNWTDSFHISIQTSKNITLNNLSFIGMTRDVISTISASEDIVMTNLYFNNCFNDHIGIGFTKRGRYENIVAKNEWMSTDGQILPYPKSTNRLFSGANNLARLQDIKIRNVYGKGMYFGGEIWWCDNLNIDNMTLENVSWALSLCNQTIGKVTNSTFRMRDNYQYGLEIAGNSGTQQDGSKVDVNGVRFTGKSYRAFLFSLTTNTNGVMNIENVNAEHCFGVCQFTHNGVNFRNIKVKEIVGIGFFALQGGDYSASDLTIENANITISNDLKISNGSYANSFVKTNDSSKYLGKLTLRDVQFIGKPNYTQLDIKLQEIFFDNLTCATSTIFKSQIFLYDLNQLNSVIKNSKVYRLNLTNHYKTDTTTSKLFIRDNMLKDCTIPVHVNIIMGDNNILT
jgi:hypothetical protein